MNSPLVDYIKISPNSNNPRNQPILKITPHHVAGIATVEQLGQIFSRPERQASSNYGIGNDGRVGMYVEEKNRAWTSSSWENDHQAITIEVSNDEIGGDWHVSDTALNKLIDLCEDICRRNGIERLDFTGDESGNLTMHKYFAATNCPGPYLESKFPEIAEEVNKRLEGNMRNEPQEWARESVEWAKANEIIFGDENGNLMLDEPCTREQMVVFLHRVYKLLK